LVGLVARGRQRDALVLGSRQADVQLLQARPRGSQGVLALGETTRQARRFRQRLIERRLQRALVVLQQQELFPHERTFGLQFHNPLVGAVGMIDENLVGLAQRSAVGGLLRQLALDIRDLRPHRHDFAGKLGFVTLHTPLSSFLSPSSPRPACCASANSRPSSSPALSNSAARFSSTLNSLRTLSWLARSYAHALRKPTLSLSSCA